VQWRGTYQERQFKGLFDRLTELTREAWEESGGIEGGERDLGARGMGGVYFGWVGEMVRRTVMFSEARKGWVEWDGKA
jgi:hypothetical protein